MMLLAFVTVRKDEEEGLADCVPSSLQVGSRYGRHRRHLLPCRMHDLAPIIGGKSPVLNASVHPSSLHLTSSGLLHTSRRKKGSHLNQL